jgi:hypothetical protein
MYYIDARTNFSSQAFLHHMSQIYHTATAFLREKKAARPQLRRENPIKMSH